jgi:hypothetical protein
MSYNAFLIAMSQLASKKKARIVIQGHLIEIEASKKKNRWNLSTTVFSEDGFIPLSIRSSLSSVGSFRWQTQGPHLKLDPISNSVVLLDEVEMPEGKFIPFRHQLNRFAHAVEEWKEILRSLADQDHMPIYNSNN